MVLKTYKWYKQPINTISMVLELPWLRTVLMMYCRVCILFWISSVVVVVGVVVVVLLLLCCCCYGTVVVVVVLLNQVEIRLTERKKPTIIHICIYPQNLSKQRQRHIWNCAKTWTC